MTQREIDSALARMDKDIRIKITIPLTPITKKNSLQIISIGGKPRPIPSKQYKDFERNAGYFIGSAAGKNIDYPVNIKCLYFMPTRRKVDLTNLLSATDDLLVHYGVLADDNCKIVAGHDGSRVLYDNGNGRTEIEITRME